MTRSQTPAAGLHVPPAQSPSGAIDAAYAACERLAGRDKPHLYSAAKLFPRDETRRAFASTYASMRIVDDAIDGIAHRASIEQSARSLAATGVEDWLTHVRRAKDGGGETEPIWAALAHTFQRFDLPITPWENLAAAMLEDLRTPSFRDWAQLRHYMQGASVAPAVVFMYLVLMRPGVTDGVFRTQWPYERVHQVTEDLAVFCYWVHILRDVSTDLTLGGTGLVYIPDEDLRQFGVRMEDLYAMRESGRATPAYTRLGLYLAERARAHLMRGRLSFPAILAAAEPEAGRALTGLVSTYEDILHALEDRDFDIFARPL
jgi:phytoene synthase